MPPKASIPSLAGLDLTRASWQDQTRDTLIGAIEDFYSRLSSTQHIATCTAVVNAVNKLFASEEDPFSLASFEALFPGTTARLSSYTRERYPKLWTLAEELLDGALPTNRMRTTTGNAMVLNAIGRVDPSKPNTGISLLPVVAAVVCLMDKSYHEAPGWALSSAIISICAYLRYEYHKYESTDTRRARWGAWVALCLDLLLGITLLTFTQLLMHNNEFFKYLKSDEAGLPDIGKVNHLINWRSMRHIQNTAKEYRAAFDAGLFQLIAQQASLDIWSGMASTENKITERDIVADDLHRIIDWSAEVVFDDKLSKAPFKDKAVAKFKAVLAQYLQKYGYAEDGLVRQALFIVMCVWGQLGVYKTVDPTLPGWDQEIGDYMLNLKIAAVTWLLARVGTMFTLQDFYINGDQLTKEMMQIQPNAEKYPPQVAYDKMKLDQVVPDYREKKTWKGNTFTRENANLIFVNQRLTFERMRVVRATDPAGRNLTDDEWGFINVMVTGREKFDPQVGRVAGIPGYGLDYGKTHDNVFRNIYHTLGDHVQEAPSNGGFTDKYYKTYRWYYAWLCAMTRQFLRATEPGPPAYVKHFTGSATRRSSVSPARRTQN